MIDVPLELPQRPDGKEWHERHLLAAELWATEPNVGWEEIADKLGISYGTAKNYALVPGWDQLKKYYVVMAQQRLYEEITRQKFELIMHGETTALATLVDAANRGNVDASYKFLVSIGFVAKNQALGNYYGELMRKKMDQENARRSMAALEEDDDE